MNVTTIGFPFGAAPGAPVFGTPDQNFARALGAAAGLGAPTPSAKAAMNDTPAPPANDAGPLMPGTNPLARTQSGTSITLAQLLAAGSKVAAVPVEALQSVPAESAGAAALQAPLEAMAEPAATPLAEFPVEDAVMAATNPSPAPIAGAKDPTVGELVEIVAKPVSDKTTALPNPTAAIKADADEAVVCPAAGEQPMPLDLPTAGRPAAGIVPTSPVATPVKTRKPIAAETDEPRLPVEPQAAHAVATPVAAPSHPIVSNAPIAQAAAPERKPDGGRAGKATSVAPIQANIPDLGDAVTPAATAAEELNAPSSDAPTDTALPMEVAVKTETRPASTPLSQSFAAQVTQSTAAHAPAHPTAAAPAAAPSEPMIPARAGQLGHALGVEIARKVEAGEDTLRVRLNPVELGRVEVTLAFDDSGNLRATMRAESRHALELLRQDAPDLGRALDSAGVRADAQSFRFESRSDGNGGAGGQSGHQQSRGNSQQSFNDESETPAPAYRAIRTDSQVDLLA